MKGVLVVLRLILSDLSPVSGYEGCAGGAEVLQAPGQGRPSVLQAPAWGSQQPVAGVLDEPTLFS